MEDADESSSENNISVSGIARFDASIHQNDKNAYRITLIKDLGSINYRSRIGFNLGSLSIEYYTFVCEFFPIVMSNVSVTASGTTISINSQTTKTFPTYTKTVVQFHRWNSTSPQFIYFDLHGSEPSNNRRILAHMVVYGVKGYFPNVPSSVFDQIYVVNNGHMVMQTDLDLNGHRLLNNLVYTVNGHMVMQTDLDLNGHRLLNNLVYTINGHMVMQTDLDLNGHRLLNNLVYTINGHMVMQTDLDLNGHRLLNNNLVYTINTFYDRDDTDFGRETFYFTFNKLSYFIFMSPCTIKDYFFLT